MSTASEIIRLCLMEKEMSQHELARKMGEDVRRLNQQINRQNDMKFSRVNEVLEHIGFRITISEIK